MKKYQENVKMCGRGSFVRFYGVRVGMATWAKLRVFLQNLYVHFLRSRRSYGRTIGHGQINEPIDQQS